MKFSIIIPVFNGQETIEKCVMSIVNQSYKNLEIIIINDGSTDNTDNICKKLSETYSSINYYNNSNHGVSYSRNFGVSVSSGDYITFVDADDFLDSNCYLEISNHINSEYDFIRYNFRCVGPNVHSNDLYDLKNKSISLKDRDSLFNHFLTYSFPIPNFVFLLLIRRDIALKLKFNEKLTMMEDVVYYLDLFLSSNKGYFLDFKGYNYFVNPNSVTHNKKNVLKNITGIVNTNVILVSKIEGFVSSDFLKSINSNHLRIISNFIINSNPNYNLFSKYVNSLYLNENFNLMLKNYSNHMNLYNRFFLLLLKNKFILLCYVYSKFIFILKSLKKTIRGK